MADDRKDPEKVIDAGATAAGKPDQERRDNKKEPLGKPGNHDALDPNNKKKP
ncbi:MAG TPA: hypothetical protein VGN79_01370 [Devosia sp.]|jgi:hypothetical protein|nr:hypothetical protein [Devosia sp.]